MSCGDINGDGQDEIIVGAPLFSTAAGGTAGGMVIGIVFKKGFI